MCSQDLVANIEPCQGPSSSQNTDWTLPPDFQVYVLAVVENILVISNGHDY